MDSLVTGLILWITVIGFGIAIAALIIWGARKLAPSNQHRSLASPKVSALGASVIGIFIFVGFIGLNALVMDYQVLGFGLLILDGFALLLIDHLARNRGYSLIRFQ